jgi:hypothetical protein
MESRPSAVSFRPQDKVSPTLVHLMFELVSYSPSLSQSTPERIDAMAGIKRSSMFVFKKETYTDDRNRVTRSGFKKLVQLVRKIQRRGTSEVSIRTST